MQDAVCNVILAVFLLSGAASAASYSAQWSKPPPLCDDSISSAALECDQDKLTGMLGGIAVSAVAGLAKCYMYSNGEFMQIIANTLKLLKVYINFVEF